MSRSSGHRSSVQSLDHIAELAQTLAPLLEVAVDAGARKSRDGLGFVGRAAVSPTWIRPAAWRSTQPGRRCGPPFDVQPDSSFRAEDELTEAGSVIANGYLRLDREEWIRVVEMRQAALGR